MEDRYTPPEPIFSTTFPKPAASSTFAICSGSGFRAPSASCDAKKAASVSFRSKPAADDAICLVTTHARVRDRASSVNFLFAAKISEMRHRLNRYFQLRQHDSSATNRFPVTIQKVGSHLSVSAGRNDNAVLSTRRHRNHRYTRSAFMPCYGIDVDSRFLKRGEQFVHQRRQYLLCR